MRLFNNFQRLWKLTIIGLLKKMAQHFPSGCFVTGLEYSADVKAEVVGKPEDKFFKSALEKLNSYHGTSVSVQGWS